VIIGNRFMDEGKCARRGVGMSKEEWVEVEVLNWSKYSPRGDVKKPSWFRVDYGMLDDPDFYSFTHEEFKAWLYVLAQACRKNTGTIRVNYDHAERVSRLSRKGIDDSLKKLESLSIVLVNVTRTSRARHADVTDTLVEATPRVALGPQTFIIQYVQAYQARYGAKARPDLRGKTQGGIKRLLGEIPLERACNLIQIYLQMNDQWFLTKAHDFGTFAENLGKVGLALDTGKHTTASEARQVDRQQGNLNGWGVLHEEALKREANHG